MKEESNESTFHFHQFTVNQIKVNVHRHLSMYLFIHCRNFTLSLGFNSQNLKLEKPVREINSFEGQLPVKSRLILN